MSAIRTFQAGEWIEHHGTAKPKGLLNHADVVVKYRNGARSPVLAAFAHHWAHHGHPSDIVAYRIHAPSPASRGSAA